VFTPRNLEADVVFDNLAIYRTESLARCLASRRHTRWHLHFAPTYPSCLNHIEGRLSFLTQRRLGPGVLDSVGDLLTEIETSTEHWNYGPESFASKNPTDTIVSRAKRGRSMLASVKSGA
jgi:putative transposase